MNNKTKKVSYFKEIRRRNLHILTVEEEKFWADLRRYKNPQGKFLTRVAEAYAKGSIMNLPDFDVMITWLQINRDHRLLVDYEIKITGTQILFLYEYDKNIDAPKYIIIEISIAKKRWAKYQEKAKSMLK